MSQPSSDAQVDVAKSAERGRFEITVDGQLAGFLVYSDEAAERSLPHTEIDDAFQGRGLASRLIHDALEITKSEGLAVLPYCPAVRNYLRKHAEYLPLVPADRLAEFELS